MYNENMSYDEFIKWALKSPNRRFAFNELDDVFPRIFKGICYIVPTSDSKLMYAKDEELSEEDFSEHRVTTFAVGYNHKTHWLEFCDPNSETAKALMGDSTL